MSGSSPPPLSESVGERLRSFETLGVEADELFALELAVIVDDRRGTRRVVLQRIRGEVRYFSTSDRRPAAEAIQMCEAFLVAGVAIESLRTPRSVKYSSRHGA